MHLLAQHGYGKSDKIERGIKDHGIQGVVFRPVNEKPDRLEAFASALSNEYGAAIELVFDPQIYFSVGDDLRLGHLPDYCYFEKGLRFPDFVNLHSLQASISHVLDYQASLPVTKLVAPSLCVRNLNDRWYSITLQMAQESARLHQEKQLAQPLLVSLIAEDTALRNRQELSEFLDIATTWSVHGFFLIVGSSGSGYPRKESAEVLANVMYLVYVLGTLNEYEVVCAYCDLPSLLLHAVGAASSSTGWFHSLRQFRMGEFDRPEPGGKRPVPRYTSMPLLNSIKLNPELQAAVQAGLGDKVLTGTSLDATLGGGNAIDRWKDDISCLHHWEALSAMIAAVSSQGGVQSNLDYLAAFVDDAIGLYAELDGQHVGFESQTGPRNLPIWKEAIALFREQAGLK